MLVYYICMHLKKSEPKYWTNFNLMMGPEVNLGDYQHYNVNRTMNLCNHSIIVDILLLGFSRFVYFVLFCVFLVFPCPSVSIISVLFLHQ